MIRIVERYQRSTWMNVGLTTCVNGQDISSSNRVFVGLTTKIMFVVSCLLGRGGGGYLTKRMFHESYVLERVSDKIHV